MEVVAGAGAVLVLGLIGLQILAVGYAAVMADHAAEAAALALVNGRKPEAAARQAVPGWPEAAMRVRSRGDRVTVALLPPTPIRFLREHLTVRGEAAVLATAFGEVKRR